MVEGLGCDSALGVYHVYAYAGSSFGWVVLGNVIFTITGGYASVR